MPDDGLKLQLLNNEAEEDQGLNEAGVETFRSRPFASIARECAQNSRDAAVEPKVKVCFDRKVTPLEELPDSKALEATLECCLSRARNTENEDELAFFENALEIIRGNDLDLLIIRDFGTAGLVGPCQPGTPFHTLVKGAGVTSKFGDRDRTSGGSFGIGKKAAFALSDLRTVFYSTVYYHGTARHQMFLAQGKCELTSHVDTDGNPRQSTGYWSRDRFQPIEDQKKVPPWLRRSDAGTTVAVVGFRPVDDWHLRIAESLVRNFFVAVHRGHIEFNIDEGRIAISENNLTHWFENSEIRHAAEEQGSLEDLELAQSLYRCLVSEEGRYREKEIPGLGRVGVRVLVGDGLPKRVCIIRNGMWITDNLGNFGDKFSRFPLYREFVAIVEPISEQSKNLFKRMETPRHDDLSAEQLRSLEEQFEAKEAMKRLAKWIRNSIREEAAVPSEDAVRLDELNRFFADGGRKDGQDPPPDAEPDPELYRYSPRSLASTQRDGTGKGAEGGAGGAGGKRGGGAGGRGSGTGSGRGGRGKRGTEGEIPVINLRNTQDAEDPGRKRRLYLTPGDSGRARLTVIAAGMNDNERLPITDIEGGHMEEGSACIEVTEGERLDAVVTFAREFDGPIEVHLVPVAEREETHAD